MKKKKHKHKKNKGIVHTGDGILWTPTWAGGANGKHWYKRLKEIQKTINKRTVTPTVTVTRRRPKDSQ